MTRSEVVRRPLLRDLRDLTARVLSPRVLFIVAILAVIATWLMLLIGGTVNPTGSSLACKGWSFTWFGMPECNGDAFPKMDGGVLYEHGHRLWGWLVGVFTTLVVVGAWVSRDLPKRTKWLALGALGLVLVQGALGGITVLLGLSPAISTAHLVVGYSCLCFMILLAWRLAPSRRLEPTAGASMPRRGVLVAAALTLAQIVLGGLMRHLGASYVCGNDLLSCGNEGLFPSGGLQLLHMLHRGLGYAVFFIVLWGAVQAMRTARQADRGRIAQLAWLPIALAAVQVALGIFTVILGRIIPVVMFHTAIGGLLLAGLVAVYLGLGPLGARRAGGTSGAGATAKEAFA